MQLRRLRLMSNNLLTVSLALGAISIGSISMLTLTGCNTLEHRSEAIERKPLPELDKPKIKPRRVWSNHDSLGVRKTDARLRLAVSDNLVVTGDSSGYLYGIDRNTGKTKWEVATDSHITSGPNLAEGRILVGTNQGEVLAYQTNGKLLWRAKLTGSVLASPVGSRGIVFAHALDGSVTALNAADGQQLWYYSVHRPPILLRRSSTPLLVDNHVVVGFANGRLTALHRLDGQPDWEREIGVSKGRSDTQRMVDVSADPILKDNIIYAVSFQGRLMALKADMGEPIWEQEISSYSGLTATHSNLFVSDSRGVLWALDRKSGRELWKQSDLTGRHLTTPTVFGDYVIVGDDEGYLHWFSAKDGSWVTRFSVDGKGIDAAPMVVGNRLYVLGRGGKVAVYE